MHSMTARIATAVYHMMALSVFLNPHSYVGHVVLYILSFLIVDLYDTLASFKVVA